MLPKTAEELLHYTKWEEFNKETSEGSFVTKENDQGETIAKYPTFTHYFFSEEKLHVFFNDHKNLLQLGASCGEFLKAYQTKGWDVVAYEYSKHAITHMIKIGLPTREIDLNSLNVNQQLTYAAKLAEDLKTPTNILAIRILSYLKPEALIALMFHMFDAAQPGSTFFVINRICKNAGEYPNLSRRFVFPPNLMSTFFIARTDMEIQRSLQVKSPEPDKMDEILVVRKLAR